MDWFDEMEPEERRPTLPPGFYLLPERLNFTFEALHQEIAWEQKTLPGFGAGPVDLPRLTAMYGSAYTYSGVHHPARPAPPLLNRVRDEVETITRITCFNSVLCNLYRTGTDSVSWHSDDDYEALRPDIVSLSFGGVRKFKIRSKTDHRVLFNIDLPHGSILLMSGRAQLDWQHSVPKTAKPVEPRINLTFRCMA